MIMPFDIAAIFAGYLLGSFPSAHIIARLWRNIDLHQEGDSHISATALHRNIEKRSLALGLILGKGLLAMYAASLLTESQIILVCTACATVAGHCWSVFLGFYDQNEKFPSRK
jgi:acyl phosphate:glycerol-3-phosphate acyltransferase